MKKTLLFLAFIILIACNQQPRHLITATEQLHIATKNLKIARNESDTVRSNFYLEEYFSDLERLIKIFPDSTQAKIADSIIKNKQFYYNEIAEIRKQAIIDKKAKEEQKIKEKEQYDKDMILNAKLNRRDYEYKLRNLFLDQGLDIKVKITGKNYQNLTLTFALFNDVWLRKFKTNGNIDLWYDMGFRRIFLTDGYDYNSGYDYN